MAGGRVAEWRCGLAATAKGSKDKSTTNEHAMVFRSFFAPFLHASRPPTLETRFAASHGSSPSLLKAMALLHTRRTAETNSSTVPYLAVSRLVEIVPRSIGLLITEK